MSSKSLDHNGGAWGLSGKSTSYRRSNNAGRQDRSCRYDGSSPLRMPSVPSRPVGLLYVDPDRPYPTALCCRPVRSHAARITNCLVKRRESDRARPRMAWFRTTRCRCLALCPGSCAISGGRVVGACTWRRKVVHCAGDEPFCATTEFPQSQLAGQSTDNALAEPFNATLKRETLQGAARWESPREARLAVIRWITRYNTRRRHSYCDYLSPADYETTHAPANIAQAA